MSKVVTESKGYLRLELIWKSIKGISFELNIKQTSKNQPPNRKLIPHNSSIVSRESPLPARRMPAAGMARRRRKARATALWGQGLPQQNHRIALLLQQPLRGAQPQRADTSVERGATAPLSGIKTQYQYDPKGNLLKKIEAVGTPDERTTDSEINGLGQTTKVTRRGRTEANGVITPDAVWQIAYDAQGQLKTLTDPEGKVRQYLFDRTGNLAQVTDPKGHVTRLDHDVAGNLIKITDALGNTTSYSYDKAGNPVSVTDARGKTTQTVYDGIDQPTQITNPVGGIRRQQYNGQGQSVSRTDEDGRIRQFDFDNFLRLASQADAQGNVTQYGYQISDGSQAGQLGSLSGPNQVQYPTFTQQARYDARERPTSQTIIQQNAQGSETLTSSLAYEPRGLVKSQTDAYGKTRSYSYTALGQPSLATDALGNQTGLQYEYDARGNLLQMKDANDHLYQFEYDRNDRLTKETLPLGQTTRYTYDAAGNLDTRTDPNGNRSQFQYDDANRLTRIDETNSQGNPLRTTLLTRDATGNVIAWSDLDARRNQTTSALLSYDDGGRKTSETVTYPQGATLGYGYAYSLSGKKTRLTWADGTNIDYGYSTHGELETVTIPGEGSLSVNQFNWRVPAQITLPGGTQQNKHYDGLLDLTDLKVKNPGQQITLSLTDVYGKQQELKQTSRTDTAATGSSSTSASYGYDDEQRLINIQNDAGSESYTLDGVANRIAHSQSGTWTFDANNRLLQQGSTTYEYDDNGNTTKKTEGGRITLYGYDSRNRLNEVRDGSNSNLIARYGYDPQNRRIWKEQYRDRDGTALTQAKRTDYLSADEGLIAEATQAIVLNADETVTANGSPAIVTQYGPRPDNPNLTATLFIKTRNSNNLDIFAYYHHDHLGTPVQATDKQGNVVWAASYHAFGMASIVTPAATQDIPTITSNLRLPGQYADEETGLYYNLNRYYDPAIGAYTTRDPIGIEGGGNQYAYVGGNPLSFRDPLGLDRWGSDPSLQQIPNSNDRVQNWLDRAAQERPNDPYGYLYDARNTYHLDRHDDNLAAAERYAGAYSGDPLYKDTNLVGDLALKLARDVCVGGYCGSDILGKNGSKDAEFVNRWGSLGNFDRENGLPYRGKNQCTP